MTATLCDPKLVRTSGARAVRPAHITAIIPVALIHAFSLIQLANALALASLLTLLATGLALVFGFRDVMNFGHGAMFMLGAYLSYSISGRFNFWVALVVVPVLLGLVGVAFEYLAARRWMSPC